MDAQLTVRLPAELKRSLDEAARKMQRKSSDVVRIALLEYLEGCGEAAPRPARRVRHLLGSLESDLPDLAERQRELILESVKRGG
jgi:Arc/MetJ-type ribon-helix-helix transcriptional regulator